MDNLIIYHQNLHRSLVPTQELLYNSQFPDDSADDGIKFLCVQEPHTSSVGVSGFGTGYNLIYKDCNTERPRAAIITKYCNILVLSQYCTSDCVLININISGMDIIICNIYCDPNGDIISDLEHLHSICVEYKGKALLITGDVNSKHSAWCSPYDDDRGRKFYDFCCAHNLTILNNGNVPTYTRSNSTSFIDVSVCSATLLPLISDWTVSDKITLSDHKLIIINIRIVVSNVGLSKEVYSTRIYKTKLE